MLGDALGGLRAPRCLSVAPCRQEPRRIHPMRWRLIALAGLVVVSTLSWEVEAQALIPLSQLLDRASRYVVGYEQAFSLLVSEEHYVQEIQRPTDPGTNLSRTNPGGGMRAGGATKRLVLRSDFLLVQLGPGQGWMPFRDVFEVNGSKVRDRDDRLAMLFLSNDAARFDQADRIMRESTRHNIGSVTRTINIPTLGMMVLHPRVRRRFTFEANGEDTVGAHVVHRIAYRETARPTLMRGTGGGDLMLQGRIWIEPSKGTVVETTVTVADPTVRANINVTFRPDASLPIWVPSQMDEYYKETRSIDEILATATYSNVRRFQVNTTEKIAKPPGR